MKMYYRNKYIKGKETIPSQLIVRTVKFLRPLSKKSNQIYIYIHTYIMFEHFTKNK